MKCPKCHSENPDTSRFCSNCATQLSRDGEVPDSLTKTLDTPVYGLAKNSLIAGKYRIIEPIGKGGMGIVYKAEDVKLRRTIALKFIPPELMRHPEMRERFVLEARAAAALDHANICTIYEVNDSEDQVFISMAYVEGQTLIARISKKLLSLGEGLDIAIQVARGLEEAHRKGIIHRDIKSGNIMVTDKGQAKIMDFGLAKMAGEAAITKEIKTMGTAAYMSPEQARGEAVDCRTDIWSLGVVLYEMFAGQLPFQGESATSILYSIVHEEPKRLKALNRAVPPEIERIIQRTLAKNPESRYASAADLAHDLEKFQESLREQEAGFFNVKSLARRLRTPWIAIPSAIGLVALVLLAIWFFNGQAKIRWARNQAIPEIMRFADKQEYWKAFLLARQVDSVVPNDPLLVKLWPQFTYEFPRQIKPGDAVVYARSPKSTETEWVRLGRVDSKPRIPRGYSLFKAEHPRFESVEFTMFADTLQNVAQTPWRMSLALMPKAELPLRMVRIEDIVDQFGFLLIFLMDSYEVTNREFKQFLDAGGYRRRELWRNEFQMDGKLVSWDDAMALFRDQTGRPGPSTWELGSYPEGKAEFPVTGVSWYEAAAYAEFVGKRLPTVYHWELGAGWDAAGYLIPGSNFRGSLAPVGSYRNSLNQWGLYDMAGNAREWCSNAIGERRFTRGGACDDPSYLFIDRDTRPPFERNPTTGFRCIKLLTPESTSEELERPILPAVDWGKEQPFSDSVWDTWMSFLSYTKVPLDAKIELVDDTSPHWRIEKVSFTAAYGGERMLAYLFLPKSVLPPFQVVAYWPGASAQYPLSSENGRNLLDRYIWEYFIKDGRALLYPILKDTYERGKGKWPGYSEDRAVTWAKDFSRALDYLESRTDIDKDRIAYLGFSWGAWMGPLPCAADKRLGVCILHSGGIFKRDELGWARRVRIPVLMINGRYDGVFPYQESQLPLFRLFATPEEHKRFDSFNTDHGLSGYEKEIMKANLQWLDKYLGPVNK